MKIMNVQENVHHTCSYNLSHYTKHHTAYWPAGIQLLFYMENCSFKSGMTDISQRRVNICVKYYFLKQFLNSASETCDRTDDLNVTAYLHSLVLCHSTELRHQVQIDIEWLSSLVANSQDYTQIEQQNLLKTQSRFFFHTQALELSYTGYHLCVEQLQKKREKKKRRKRCYESKGQLSSSK